MIAEPAGMVLAWQAGGRRFESQPPQQFLFFVISVVNFVVTTRLLYFAMIAELSGMVLAWQAGGRRFESQPPQQFLFFVISDKGRCIVQIHFYLSVWLLDK